MLNENQLQAVNYFDSHLLITAGPGTGKTHTLTQKIIHLIKKEKISPQNILALTFTNKARQELNSRLKNFKIAHTFHSFSLKTLDMSETNIISPDDRQEIVKNLAKENKIKPQNLESIISHHKINNSLDALTQKYNLYLLEKKLVDYDDLLINTLNLKTLPKFRYLFIDEFQDTNNIQYQIIKKLNPDHITAIGDPNQSIYGFRGSLPQIFDQFVLDFPGTKMIYLDTNYRSRPKIIRVTNSLFPEIKIKSQKKLKSQVQLIKTVNKYSEADFIINFISHKVGGLNLLQASEFNVQNLKESFNSFAIIYRTHQISKIIQKKFRDSGIPYQRIGSESLFQNKNIKLIIKYLLEETEKKDNDLEKIIKELKLTDTQYLKDFRIIFSQFENKNDFLDYLKNLKQNDYYDNSADKVTLLTMHASKGLEFNYVFIIGFEDGIIPQSKTDSDLLEEKRLLYVAMTRAKKALYLFTYKNVSRFIKDLKYVDQIIDEKSEKKKQRQEIYRLKKSQMSLF